MGSQEEMKFLSVVLGTALAGTTPAPNAKDNPNGWTILPDMGCPGGQLNRFETASLYTCMDECDQLAGCNAYTFVVDELWSGRKNQCYLLNHYCSNAQPYESSDVTGITSAYKSDNPNDWVMMPGISCQNPEGGWYVRVETTSAYTCMEQCDLMSECNSFFFAADELWSGLKNQCQLFANGCSTPTTYLASDATGGIGAYKSEFTSVNLPDCPNDAWEMDSNLV